MGLFIQINTHRYIYKEEARWLHTFYDKQIARFLTQFARIFSNWYVTFGYDAANNPILHRVPIQYGDSSRQAATIINKNSASNLPSAPMITYYISGLEYDQRRTQDPFFVDKMNVRQRTFNTETGEYEQTQGNAFTVERVMPVPYTLRITVDVWTTSTQQKLEIIEQLGVLFNPSIEIQSTDNFIDWTSLSVVYQDGLNFTSRSIPIGTGNPIDVLTWKFYMPVWLSSPAKVKKMGVIQKIIASIFKGSYKDDISDEDLLLGTRQKITPYGYKLLLLGNQLQILPASQPQYPSNDSFEMPNESVTDIYWHSVLNVYGTIREGISMIALENPYWETEIMGTITYNPLDDRVLIFNIDSDTLPQDTLEPVDSIINPEDKFPGNGLPAAREGQRYLIVSGIAEQQGYPSPATLGPAWPGLENGAAENSIIEYDGTSWGLSFNSQAPHDVQFVTNLTSGVQYRFIDGGWQKSYEGFYDQGNWRVII